MAVVKITKRVLDSLSPKERPFIVYDQDLKGFGISVSPKGTKTWIVEYRPHPGGRNVPKKRMTLGSVATVTHEEARKSAREILANVRLGRDPASARADDRSAPTLHEVMERYLSEHVGPKLKPGTATLYRHLLTKMVAPSLGRIAAKAVTRLEVERFHLGEATRRPTLANRAVVALSACYNWAGERGIVPSGCNPAKAVKRFREARHERFLRSDEIERLSAVIREAETIGLPWVISQIKPTSKHLPRTKNRRTKASPHVAAAIRLLMLTGARLREILHLRWIDVDLSRAQLRLPDSKTGAKTIFLSEAAVVILRDLPRVGRYVIAGDSPDQPRSDLKRPWEAIRRYAGLQDVRIHDLRHSYASIGVAAGLGLPIIAKLLGQTQLATTERYAHLDCDFVSRAANVIGEVIHSVGSSNKKVA